MTRMGLKLYARRKRMLELYYAGAFTPKTFTALSEQEGVTADALRRDWRNRGDWEPLIWKAEQSGEDINNLLYILQMARERAVSLMRAADQDSVKVAAVGRVTEIVRREIELKQSLGLLTKAADKLEINGKIEVPQLEGLDSEAICATIKNILEKEARELHPTSTDSVESPKDST